MILEVERFYEIEVNGVRCSIGWDSCFPVNRRRRPLRRVQGGLTVGDVEPEAVSGWREAGPNRQTPGNRARRKGGCSHHTRGYPVSIPHDIENRGVATGIDRELNPRVIGPIMPPPQLTEPTRLNLSRW